MPQKAKYPVVRKFTIDTDGTSDVYVDIGRCLSAMNHRLYRQGRLYRVRVSVTSPTNPGVTAITTLPDTWYARTAYNKVRDIWMTRIEGMKKEHGKLAVGRWNDFHVGYDATHRTNFTSSKLPEEVTDATGTQAAISLGNADWNLSPLLDNDGNEVTFRFLSKTSTSNVFNILDTFENAHNIFAPDPSGTGASAYADFNLGEGGDQSGLQDEGDYPPYHETDFPQLEVLQNTLVVLGDSSGAARAGRMSTGYFDAPLGLLRITPTANEEITIEVQAGDYKGVEAPDWK